MRVRSNAPLAAVVVVVGFTVLSSVFSPGVFTSGTASATATGVPRLDAVPEGNAGNANRTVPSANIWFCVTGPCSGPGEGDLKVIERASDVQTASGVATGHGLGAYEFTVAFDGSAIQSVNPADIVFSANRDKSFDGSPMSFGLSYRLGRTAVGCSVSSISESRIHFGCVTSGPGADVPGGHDGPSGSFALAMLDVVPFAGLTNRMYPVGGNGVMTVIAQQGCELVDIYGHPVIGALEGGAVSSCGDLAATVRILEGDVNLDCQVDVIDETLISYRMGAVFPSPWYNRWFDLEPATRDGDIDVKDVQQVFGREGSTCQNPLPRQAPQLPPYALNN